MPLSEGASLVPFLNNSLSISLRSPLPAHSLAVVLSATFCKLSRSAADDLLLIFSYFPLYFSLRDPIVITSSSCCSDENRPQKSVGKSGSRGGIGCNLGSVPGKSIFARPTTRPQTKAIWTWHTDIKVQGLGATFREYNRRIFRGNCWKFEGKFGA